MTIDIAGMTTEERDQAIANDLTRLHAELDGIAERITDRLRTVADVVDRNGVDQLHGEVVALMAEAARLAWLAEDVKGQRGLEPSVTSLAEVQRGRTSA